MTLTCDVLIPRESPVTVKPAAGDSAAAGNGVTVIEEGRPSLSLISPLTLTPALAETHNMADSNSNFAATPYPMYNVGGNDAAATGDLLTAHAGASIERNQDAQFSAGRDRALTENVLATSKDNAIVGLENRVAVEARAAVSDRHRDRQFSDLRAELVAMRAEAHARDVVSLRAELADAKAAARNDQLTGILNRLAVKLGA